MAMHYENDSATGEYLKISADLEHDDPDQAPTCRLPVLCPGAFEAMLLTPAEAKAALVEEFGEAA
jgi:hypothetical protein